LGSRHVSGSPPELSLVPDTTGYQPEDPLIVQWADGVKWVVPDWTVARLESVMAKSSGSKPARPKLWESEHTVTHHEVHIAQRCDRSLLLSVFEQTRQIAQIRVIDFAAPDTDMAKFTSPPVALATDDPCVQAALRFIVPFAKAYCNGELPTPAELKNKIGEAKKDRRAAAKPAKRQRLSTKTAPQQPGLAEKPAIVIEDSPAKHDSKPDTQVQGQGAPRRAAMAAAPSAVPEVIQLLLLLQREAFKVCYYYY